MKIFAYDLETTGTNPGQHGIHQIAGIILIDGKEKERFEIKLRPNPKAKIDPEALKACNVTEEQIMAYQPMEDGYQELIGILGKHVNKFDKKDKFFTLGYNNAGFDDNFLRGLFLQNGDVYYGSWFWSHCLDVMILATRQLAIVRPQMVDFKLKTVAAQMGIQVDESKLHDAVYDVELTYEIFKKLRLTTHEIQGIYDEFKMQEAIQLAFEQLEEFEALPEQDQNSQSGKENIQIALNILRKFIKPAVTACLIFLLSCILIQPSYGQFKDKGPKGDQLKYNAWLQNKYRHNGFKLNPGQWKALGMKNGFLNTGIAANWSKNKQDKNPLKLSKSELKAIKEEDSPPKPN